MRKLSTSQLRAFDAVAREGGMSRAAQLLNVTQPTVTVQIRQLEERCGFALFRRGADGVTLTEQGERLFELTRRMFTSETLIEDFVDAARGLEIGALTLAADGPHVALDVIAAFRADHPGVRLSVRLANAGRVLEEVRAGRVDAAIMGEPTERDGLFVEPILAQGMVAALPVGHPLSAEPRVALADLLREPLIVRERGSNTRRFLEAAAVEADLPLDPVLELGSREAVKEAVAIGLGVSVLLDREAVGDDRLVAVPVGGLDGVNVDALVCPAGAERRAAMRALRRAAKRVGGSGGGGG